jgi:ABC-type sugar transport system ATPase subunit
VSTGASDQLLLRATGVTKHFGGIQALRGVDLEMRSGEIHALMGENGAGKSTLAKIIAGVESADSGTITWLGERIAFHTTAEANSAGITIVLQELSLIPHLSVAENIFLTNSSAYRGGWWLNRGLIRQQMYELLEQFGLHTSIDPDRKVQDLSIAEQQMIEILRAFSQEARFFILDEPTAALGQQEVDLLFGIVRRLREQGASFLVVTHRLDEVFALSDRITVFRDGANSGHFITAETTPEELIRAMVGRDLGDMFGIRTRHDAGEPILVIRNLSRGERVQNCSLDVRRGEIVGIAGLVGAGRTELIRAIFGADRAESGEVELNGKAGIVRSPVAAIDQGAAMVPEDRKRHGLLIDLPIAQNISLADLTTRKGFWLRAAQERARVEEMAQRLQIRMSNPWSAAGSLSGGNQQKIVLAKWLAIDPDLLILDEPTRGIDVGTKYEIYKLIDSLAAQGKAILLVSSELPEILALADRVLVMSDGEIVAELGHDEASEEVILAHAAHHQAEFEAIAIGSD